ncbi:MAG: hypothetical protein RL653_1881 [Pseudomonadota bacterium]|jgi:hypothetical protein
MRSFVLALSLTAASLAWLTPASALADGCYICKRGSTCGEQCRYGSKDTSEARKACEKRGCKVGGTKSCSTAANAKTCALPHADTASQYGAATAPGSTAGN